MSQADPLPRLTSQTRPCPTPIAASQPPAPAMGLMVFLPGFDIFDDGSHLLDLDKPEARKRYTAERLNADLTRRAGIISALADGRIGLHRIAKAYRVSVHTVVALRDHPEARREVATEKKSLADLARAGASICLERYIELVHAGTVKADTLPFGFGILVQRAAELDGEASVIVEHRTREAVTPQNFSAWLEALARAQPVSPGENAKQIGEAIEIEAAAGAPRVDQDGQRAIEPAGDEDPARSDVQSVVSPRERGHLLQDPLQSEAENGPEHGEAGGAETEAQKSGARGSKRGGGGGRKHPGGGLGINGVRPHKIF